MKKFISILLAICACFSFMLTACKNSQSNSSNEVQKPIETDNARVRYQGTHIFNIKESDTEYLIKNGTSDYKILIPNVETKYTNLGADEFSTLFREATNVQLPVERESGEGYTHNKNQRLISIGNTELFKSTGLVVDSQVLKKEGYRIVTKDNNIYLFTAVDVGNLYAAYELLEILFNFEYFYHDCYVIDKGVLEKKLPVLDVTDVPDFQVRKNATKSIRVNTDDLNAAHRLRFSEESYMLNLGDVENGQVRKGFHNSSEVLPRGAATDEDKWHADGNAQLCYTAHGDAESYKRMVKRAAYIVEQSLIVFPREKYPSYNMASISCEDEFTSCSCETCSAETLKYGAKSASIIKFLNNVMVEVRAWMDLPENEPYKRDEFYLMFFAYFEYLPAPATYNEELGKYVLNEDLEFRPDVGVMYAVNDVTSTVSMYDKANETTRKNSKAWFDVAPATYIWTYSGNTDYQASMWPSYEHLDEDGYNFYASGNPVYFQDYIDYFTENDTGFLSLKLYIDSQMMWDCSQSIADLKEKWFKAMFGEVNDVMRRLFEQELLYVTNVYDKYGARVKHGWGITYNADDWSLPEMKLWIDIIKEAWAKNEEIYKESDPEKFEMIKHHIDQEFAFPALAVVMGQTKEAAGQFFVDIVKYLQANEETFKGYYTRHDRAEIRDLWINLDVGE